MRRVPTLLGTIGMVVAIITLSLSVPRNLEVITRGESTAGSGKLVKRESSPSNWYRGNLHTHTLWSDGDAYPEVVVDWYRDHGYNFLALSDHNVLSEGARWFDTSGGRGAGKPLVQYLREFGDPWVETKRENGKTYVRLRTLEEFRPLFEVPGEFLMIQSEEITSAAEGKPIHINATNIQELIEPIRKDTVYETMQANVDQVLAQRKRLGVPMFPHLNHPNFGWAVTAEDIMKLEGEKFFEVYNGHPAVHNYGDDTHSGAERIWDIVLTKRLAELGLPVMYGIAVDDSHSYYQMGTEFANPGRGWVMVRAGELTPAAIIAAMERGDFYASTGVTIDSIERRPRSLSFRIAVEPGVEYTTEFIGTRLGYDHSSDPKTNAAGEPLGVTREYSDEIGEVLATVHGANPSYTFKGDEIYVRAKVTSSKPKRNPYRDGETEMAWVQPVVLKR